MNKKKIEINLQPSEDRIEEFFEVKDENIIRVSAFVPEGNKPKEVSENCHVIIEMSKDAMIGFATELLRMAYDKDEDIFKELLPSDQHNLCQYMGIFLKSDSCRLSISKQDMGKVKDI